MLKDRLIAESCDFGVVYSLYLKQPTRAAASTSPRPIVKISWDVEHPGGEMETLSCVFELNLTTGKMWALGRKGNQLPTDHFSAEKICAWAKKELEEFLSAEAR